MEYWDNERRRFPQYDHVAVIVAEEITGRFLNVINLFNQAIPLIAIQMSALDVNGRMTLHATKVLDLALPASEEEDEPGQATDRSYWERISSPQMLGVVDKLLGLVNERGPQMSLKYNKQYIGLQRDGISENPVTFVPRKKHVLIGFHIERSEELDAKIDNAGLTLMRYDVRHRNYWLTLEPSDVETNQDVLRELIQLARGLPIESPRTAPEIDTANSRTE